MLLDKVSINGRLSIEELRALSGMSQREFAKEIGIPYSTYVKKERDASKFLANEVGRICHRFKLSVNKIEM